MSYFIGRLCEEFPAYGPEEAYQAWLRLPAGFMEEIIEGRRYAEAKWTLDHAKSKAELPNSPMMRLAKQITLDLAREELKPSRKRSG